MKWKRIKCFLTGGHRLYDKTFKPFMTQMGITSLTTA